MIDQTRLPVEFVEIDCRDVETVWEAIKVLARSRGAGHRHRRRLRRRVSACRRTSSDGRRGRRSFQPLRRSGRLSGHQPADGRQPVLGAGTDERKAAERLRGRPTGEIAAALLAEAQAIHEEDRQMCRAIGRHGAALLSDGQGVLTHCNAGGLATSDYGTALAVFFAAAEAGKTLHVYADETRPLLQGARLTAWELQQRGIDVTLICDSMAAQVMREGRVQAVVAGADRIAANGDTANKIGTYGVALLAAAHKIPFYIAAPSSTFDLSIASGAEIPIEQRDPREVTHGFGRPTAPGGCGACTIRPSTSRRPDLITAIICERGVIQPVNRPTIAAMLGAAKVAS